MSDYPCNFCSRVLPSSQGLRSHIAQSADHQEQLRALETEIDHDSADDDDLQPGLPSPSAYNGSSQYDSDDAPPDPSSDHDPSGFDGDEPEPASKRARVEEVEDEQAPPIFGREPFVEPYPEEKEAGKIYGRTRTSFEEIRVNQSEGEEPWAPFESEAEWEVARWMMRSGISQKETESFLKLEKIRTGVKPSFHNNRAFLQQIDALPRGPEWTCEPFVVTGDEVDDKGQLRTEEVDLWRRDPVECVKELLSNPSFRENMSFAPEKQYRNSDGTNRVYNESWTGDWWWDTQDKLAPGSTIAPLILSSDKTQLSRFSGDKQAWPLFHDCMRSLLLPLVEAGKTGVKMTSADGAIRLVFPLLAAYIADYPEQCLIACCQENSCPKCTVTPKERGGTATSIPRDPTETAATITSHLAGLAPAEFGDQCLRPVKPFWEDLPHCDIFNCMTPDILHQLHKGVFKDHLVSWSTAATLGEEAEVDLRFRAMTPHPSLRHFKKGISLVSQWTGTEFKNMEKVFLGIIAGATNASVIRALRGVIDFIYYAHFQEHDDESLAQLDAAWVMFHENKDIFVELEIRKHFNINKLHQMKHYFDMIRMHGTCDGYNSEGTERLHIDYAKMGYLASNRVGYIKQMTKWLYRQEAVYRFTLYLQWVVPRYVAEIINPGGDDEQDWDEGDDDDDEAEVEGRMADEESTPAYTIAKYAPYPNTPIATIIGDYGAKDFIWHLEDFLRRQSMPTIIPDHITFPVYKRLSLQLPALPAVSELPVKDTIRADKHQPSNTKSGKKEVPAHFDTVLAAPTTVPSRDGFDDSLEGLGVAQVRLVFRLPASLGTFNHPLAYVEWFTPLRVFDTDLGMYQVSPSTRIESRRASVIPVTQIHRSCHLFPQFKKSIDPSWDTNNVLKECKTFYVSPYLRHHDFYLFRYLPSTVR
ncbi:hypothetical protein FIBSPDRAFT_908162 [Athelia psychrophila]|uniref:C2H2-type domain-containing protein n=1 Tax=Athelia psychrophila TaxID=1759441 RepID=A0A166T510_9AGAM|nr:hypothetical protein FIBSPDRAFT_908162 [Fibularhizoctonia sp. CBS 109695]